METYRLSRAGNVIRTPDGKVSKIRANSPAQQGKEAALTDAKSFLAKNPSLVRAILDEEGGVEPDFLHNAGFMGMVNRIKSSRLSRQRFFHEMSVMVENSPSSPELSVGRTIAQGYTDLVYSEVKRLGIETKAKK